MKFSTQAAEETRTQAKNSTTEEAFEKNSRNKINFTIFSLKTEIFLHHFFCHLYMYKRSDRSMPDNTLLPFHIFFNTNFFIDFGTKYLTSAIYPEHLIPLFQQLDWTLSKSPIAYINLH